MNSPRNQFGYDGFFAPYKKPLHVRHAGTQLRGTTQLEGNESFHLFCANRDTAENSKPVIQILHFYRFAATTGSLEKITDPTSDSSSF